jgi:hypothetical protein
MLKLLFKFDIISRPYLHRGMEADSTQRTRSVLGYWAVDEVQKVICYLCMVLYNWLKYVYKALTCISDISFIIYKML